MINDLSGLKILVTRAQHQSADLCDLINKFGGEPIEFPVSEVISTNLNEKTANDLRQKLKNAGILIFVSPNSVICAFHVFRQWKIEISMNTKILAVGPGTAKQLSERGIRIHSLPKPPYDSDALIDLPILQDIRNYDILIFKGLIGREIIKDSLLERGANVEDFPCYEIVKAKTFDHNVIEMWRKAMLDVVILGSTSAADHLRSILEEEALDLMLRILLVVPSRRVADYCISIGFRGNIKVSDDASLSSLVNAIIVHKNYTDKSSRGKQ